MPFNVFRRRDAGTDPPPAPVPSAATPGTHVREVGFDGVSEEWRLVGRMRIDGRLSDALNRRESIELSEMRWAPIDGATALEEAPGLKVVDPYDLILVLAGDETLPALSEQERGALRIHKLTYDVALELPPFRVVGRVHLFPGTDPSVLLERRNEMFFPVTNAVATHDGRPLSEGGPGAVLVNRSYLRGVEQLDSGDEPES